MYLEHINILFQVVVKLCTALEIMLCHLQEHLETYDFCTSYRYVSSYCLKSAGKRYLIIS